LAITVRDGRAGAEFQVLAEVDPELETPPAETVTVAAGATERIRARLLPSRRGLYSLRRVWLRWRGPLQLMAITTSRAIDHDIAVVPDVGTVRATALRFFGAPESRAGIKVEHFVGEGSEFESLHRYVPGVDPRNIDWKASARHRRLLSRRFRAERNHQVVLAIDTGNLMRESIAGIPRVDHAINRALVLAYLCLRTGDRVGMYAFDAEPRSYLAPQGGVNAFPRLQRETAGIDYKTSETNFTLGMLELSQRLRRRSLVVVFTEFVDTVTAELMLDNLDRLARRHLILFVALRDPGVEQIERRCPERLGDMHEAVVASGIRMERERVFESLKRRGIHVVDALPDHVTAELLNRYLEIKRRELV